MKQKLDIIINFLQQENKDLPKFLHPESMGVFVEGWALYAESLAKNQDFMMIQFNILECYMEMYRAIRLVVDTVCIVKDGQEKKPYNIHQTMKLHLKSLLSQKLKDMATPGQALSYKIGQIKIREFGTKAEIQPDEKFDIREFQIKYLTLVVFFSFIREEN